MATERTSVVIADRVMRKAITEGWNGGRRVAAFSTEIDSRVKSIFAKRIHPVVSFVVAIQKALHVVDVVSPHGIEKRPGPGHRDDVVYDGGEEWTRTGDERQVQRAVSQLVPISIESFAEMVRESGFLILHELDIKPIQYLDFERANELQQNENRPDDFVNARTGEIDEIKHEDRRENHNVDDRKQRSPHSRLSLPAFTADV